MCALSCKWTWTSACTKHGGWGRGEGLNLFLSDALWHCRGLGDPNNPPQPHTHLSASPTAHYTWSLNYQLLCLLVVTVLSSVTGAQWLACLLWVQTAFIHPATKSWLSFIRSVSLSRSSCLYFKATLCRLTILHYLWYLFYLTICFDIIFKWIWMRYWDMKGVIPTNHQECALCSSGYRVGTHLRNNAIKHQCSWSASKVLVSIWKVLFAFWVSLLVLHQIF